MDVDTFFSIAYSICASNTGIKDFEDEAKNTAYSIFDDDLMEISRRLLQTEMKC